MNNHPSNDNYSKTLSFSSFVSDANVSVGDVSVLKRAVWRLFSDDLPKTIPRLRTADREAAAGPIAELRVVSRYEVDDYGRPRILSKWEVTLHALAWPVILGVVIGFGLAISQVVVSNFSTLQMQGKATPLPVGLQELAP